MNAELYQIMRDVYTRFTGKEVAEVVAQIRHEINVELERQQIEERLEYLTDHLRNLK